MVPQQGGGIYAEPGKDLSAAGPQANFDPPTYENTVLNGGGGKEEGRSRDEDYMNQDPQGLFHTYSNQDDLMQQVRTERRGGEVGGEGIGS